MLNRMDYQIGEQPCADFTPGEPAAGVAAKIAACPGCEGTICLCEKCKRDHHSAGWGTCDRRISCKVAGAALRMGLYTLTQLLDVLDDWALAAGHMGIRRLIYGMVQFWVAASSAAWGWQNSQSGPTIPKSFGFEAATPYGSTNNVTRNLTLFEPCLIYDQRKEIWWVLKWFGTPFANTNTNSNSKEDLDSRITNSNSSSNTNYEEQAP